MPDRRRARDDNLMITAARNYLIFFRRSAGLALVGDWRYYAWMGALTVITLVGLNAYAKQLVHGLVVTGMSDEARKPLPSKT